MNNTEIHPLIERYLNGELPQDEHDAIETRIANDPDFSAEVTLHRQLHEELSDPKKLQLRDLMQEIVEENPPPSIASPYGWLKGPGIALLLLLLGWTGWQWLAPAANDNSSSPVRQDSVPPPMAPTKTPPSTRPPAVIQPQHRPMAVADPKAFAPNREFEDRLGSQTRAINGSAAMQSPAIGANFTLEGGLVNIFFQGATPANADDQAFPLRIKIFSNQQGTVQPVVQFLPKIDHRKTTSGEWSFSARQKLRLTPGIYYFILEYQVDEEVAFVGKFTVAAR